MSLRAALIGGSLLAHAGRVVALGGIRAPSAIAATSIEVFESTKSEPPPPAKVEPTPPEPAAQHDPPPRARAAKAAPAPAPETPPAPAPAHALDALPDLGLELGNGGGPGGLALPATPAAAPRPAATSAKTLSRGPAPARPAVDACDEPPAKPKLLNLPQPAYTDAARAANVEGKVRIEIVVDEAGKVVSVRALTSLGHGLDEAALTAARAATFEPAVRCGRPSRSTFNVSIRFSAS